MPPETNDMHSKLGNHAAQLEGHRRELDGLWDANDDRRADIEEQQEQLTKVRIQMAVILAVGGAFVVLVQAVATKFTIEAITKMMGGN